ncbi:MAG TPA: EamA family transporter [Candidatus Eubacterium faecavium]|nr:EamA family transporter [Candidatus Eubacterium faecavium]
MWLLFAVGSAFFSGITAILAKCGIRKTDSTVATAVRTVVVLLFSWLMVFIVGSEAEIGSMSAKTVVFLILSGIATGASWLCYFKALQTGDINKVVPIDKFSTVLTMLLAMIFLNEGMSLLSAAAIVLISAGTFLMIQKQNTDVIKSDKNDKSWLIYAVLSAVFAALTSILGKVGIENVESNLGTAIRTCVVLVMAWLMVFVTGKTGEVRQIPRKDLLFICLSGFATGGAWLCYYKALQDGPASVVVPVDKLSILITILFSYIVFKEKLSKKSLFGLLLIVVGTICMVIPAMFHP